MIAKANTSYSRHSSRYLFPLMSRLQQHCPSAQCSVLAGPLQQPPHTSPTFSPLLPPILRLQTSLFAASFRLCLVRLLASIPTAPTLHPSSRLLTYRVHSSNIALSKIENQATPQTIQEAEPAAQTRQTADTVSQTPPPPPARRAGRRFLTDSASFQPAFLSPSWCRRRRQSPFCNRGRGGCRCRHHDDDGKKSFSCSFVRVSGHLPRIGLEVRFDSVG